MVALGSVCTLALAACGGTASSGSDKALVLGVSVPLSGPVAAAGFAQGCGVEAYLKSVSGSDELNGYEVEVRKEDSQYDPSRAASIARNFANDGVFAAYVAGTAPAEASRPALESRRIPTFATADGAMVTPPPWDGQFGYYPSYVQDAKGTVEFISSTLDAEKMAFAYSGPAGEPVADAMPSITKDAGVELAAVESVPVDTTDFASLAHKLKSSGAQAVYVNFVDTQIAALQKASDAIGYDPEWVLNPFAYGPKYLELAGGLAAGTYVAQWAWPSTQTSEPSVKAYRSAVADLGGDCADQVDDTNTGIGYNVGSIIAHGISEATEGGAEPTSESFIKALEFKDLELGTTPLMTYSSDSHAAVAAQSFWKVAEGGGDVGLEKVTDFAPLPK
ncbi:ABC transporter substrate-binding protein [Streptomyces blattellae]|uniref:ABC transporter substrate-binding protein n=1 Tax=Streptomyces blattellae TaxID=2569855 RepID=UPI0018ACC701|nr:ABC transporter substrate-binding protein [Streptomyces blattellae]